MNNLQTHVYTRFFHSFLFSKAQNRREELWTHWSSYCSVDNIFCFSVVFFCILNALFNYMSRVESIMLLPLRYIPSNFHPHLLPLHLFCAEMRPNWKRQHVFFTSSFFSLSIAPVSLQLILNRKHRITQTFFWSKYSFLNLTREREKKAPLSRKSGH